MKNNTEFYRKMSAVIGIALLAAGLREPVGPTMEETLRTSPTSRKSMYPALQQRNRLG
jgi:hypothetical protein